MREHTRTNGRYERTEVGTLTLDLGSNGADYTVLDFSYVLKGKMGNLFKIYGQVRRNPDGCTYDTYDTKAGNRRLRTEKNATVNRAIREHVKAVAGVEVYNLEVKMPIAPDSIRDALGEIIYWAISRWDYFWRGESEEEKETARKEFATTVWPCDRYFIEPLENAIDYKPIGILNVDVREHRQLYRDWRDFCEGWKKKGE